MRATLLESVHVLGGVRLLHPSPGLAAAAYLVVPVAAGTTKARVDAMSTALGQAPDAIAGRLAP